jgi:hypothetical protein
VAKTLLEMMSDAELGVVADEMAGIYERAMSPSEMQIIAKMVHYGCPRQAAQQQMNHPGLALYARQFYVDAEDAEHGDPDAKERVEKCREAWSRLNAQIARAAKDHVLD